MNAIAEPVELLEAECNAQGWYDPSVDDEDYAPMIDEACSERVLGWTVERICATEFPAHSAAPASE
jgi:hypothetical protein